MCLEKNIQKDRCLLKHHTISSPCGTLSTTFLHYPVMDSQYYTSYSDESQIPVTITLPMDVPYATCIPQHNSPALGYSPYLVRTCYGVAAMTRPDWIAAMRYSFRELNATKKSFVLLYVLYHSISDLDCSSTAINLIIGAGQLRFHILG